MTAHAMLGMQGPMAAQCATRAWLASTRTTSALIRVQTAKWAPTLLLLAPSQAIHAARAPQSLRPSRAWAALPVTATADTLGLTVVDANRAESASTSILLAPPPVQIVQLTPTSLPMALPYSACARYARKAQALMPAAPP